MTDKNNALILEMIDIFIPQVEEMWKEMQSLYDRKDYEGLGNLAHKAKSSVAIMGMEEMSRMLKDLEISCREKKNTLLYQGIIDSFRSEGINAIRELEEYKKNH